VKVCPVVLVGPAAGVCPLMQQRVNSSGTVGTIRNVYQEVLFGGLD